MTKYSAIFSDGTIARRTSDRTYSHAAKRAGRVSFHGSYAAARRASGQHGSIVRVEVEGDRAATGCIVCGDDPRGIPSRSAVTGETTWHPCHGSAHRA